jgi:hypothetical protein
MLKKITLIATCSVLILFSGCASQDQYRNLEAEDNNAQLQIKEDEKTISNLQVQNKKLLNQNKNLRKTNSALMARLNNEKSDGKQNNDTFWKKSRPADQLSRPYSILLSSCQKQESVQKVISTYQGSELDPFVVQVDLGEKGVWWRIFSGHFETRKAAVDVKHKSGLSDKTVIKLSQADLVQVRADRREAKSDDSSLVKEALSLFE